MNNARWWGGDCVDVVVQIYTLDDPVGVGHMFAENYFNSLNPFTKEGGFFQQPQAAFCGNSFSILLLRPPFSPFTFLQFGFLVEPVPVCSPRLSFFQAAQMLLPWMTGFSRSVLSGINPSSTQSLYRYTSASHSKDQKGQ
jgi:hypothetical protein